MNINNDNLSDKEKSLDTSIKTARKQHQWTIDSSTALNSQDESLVGNDNKISGNRSRYNKDNILSETGSNFFSTRRGSFVLSDSESNRSPTTLLSQPNTRRRALSTTSKDRFSMHEFGTSRIDDVRLSPARHSMAFDSGFNINNKLVRRDPEWTIDRERIGNAGKGFGNLIDDEDGKESIADLIADVKDEEAVKLALLITKRNSSQKNRMHNAEADIEKTIDGSEFHPSETTLSNSKMCKQFLENKYHVLFKVINNGRVYNPLRIVKNRKNDMAREGSDHSSGSSEKFNNNRLISNRAKSRGSLLRRKESSIWDVSHMEIMKDYEEINKFHRIHEVKSNGNFDDKDYQESDLGETDKQQKCLQLTQMFNPPTTQEMEQNEDKGSSNGQLKEAIHSRPLINSVTAASQGKEDSYNKSKKWSIHLFKRKDKRNKNESNVGATSDYYLSTNAKNVSESSSDGQTSRSSLESSSEKGKNLMRQVNSENVTYDYHKLGSKFEKDIPRVLEEKHNHTIDDWADDASSHTSIGHSNNSSTRNSMDLEPDAAIADHMAGSLNTEDRCDKFKFLGEDNRLHRFSSGSKTTEYSESEEEYEDGLARETVLVNLDVLPQELVDLVFVYQKQGIVDRNVDNENFVKLDIRFNEEFKFRKLISHGADLLTLRISLVNDDYEDTESLNQQDADEIIKRCDKYIQKATKTLEDNEILLAEKKVIIENNNYVSNGTRIFESLDIPFALSPIHINSPNTSAFSFSDVNHLPSQSIIAECKMSIEEGIKLLNNKLVNIGSTVNKLEGQHASFAEEMETMLNEIEKMTLDVNNDYFRELKILEDEIHLLISEKSSWLDIFYLMMSYVLTGVMFMFWFVVACFILLKKILLAPYRFKGR